MASHRPTSLSSPAALIHLRLQPLPSIPPLHPTTLPFPRSLPLHLPSLRLNGPHLPPLPLASSGSGSGITGTGSEADLPPLPLASSGSGSGVTGTGGEDGLPPSGGGGGEGGGDGEGEGDGSYDAAVNRREALFVLAQLGRKLESLPADLAAAVDGGRIPGEIVRRFVDLEASPVFRWILQFGGFKERLLADDLFLTKVGIECGVGIFTKTAAEYEKRRENFVKELDFVIADVAREFILFSMPTLLKLEVLSCLLWMIQQVQQITLFTLSISTLRAGVEGHGGETGPPSPRPSDSSSFGNGNGDLDLPSGSGNYRCGRE
ncbi:protein RETICULATA-RELATED 4, chloroplastic-like [Miscanthus floridulus]|uniref:protein RETICULATA-RELATED 4, chloroplastic-like n=1 Tax=Miscanthus floridulus TaxID=154761 RepID=UPI003459A7A3